VEKFSAVVTTVFVHPWVHPYVVLFVCLPSVKQLKFVLHLLLNKCSVYIYSMSLFWSQVATRSAIYGLGLGLENFSQIMSNFSIFSPSGWIKSLWVGSKITRVNGRSTSYFLQVKSMLESSRVRSGPISSFVKPIEIPACSNGEEQHLRCIKSKLKPLWGACKMW